MHERRGGGQRVLKEIVGRVCADAKEQSLEVPLNGAVEVCIQAVQFSLPQPFIAIKH